MSELGMKNLAALVVILVFLTAFFASIICALPNGPISIIYKGNATKNTSTLTGRGIDQRSTIVTVKLNVSQQTVKWKAYVGNITGKITLDDAQNYTIYDWTVSQVQGKVFATRRATAVNWNTVICANNSVVEAEMVALNHAIKTDDTINKTFTPINHPGFWAGPTSLLQTFARRQQTCMLMMCLILPAGTRSCFMMVPTFCIHQ